LSFSTAGDAVNIPNATLQQFHTPGSSAVMKKISGSHFGSNASVVALTFYTISGDTITVTDLSGKDVILISISGTSIGEICATYNTDTGVWEPVSPSSVANTYDVSICPTSHLSTFSFVNSSVVPVPLPIPVPIPVPVPSPKGSHGSDHNLYLLFLLLLLIPNLILIILLIYCCLTRRKVTQDENPKVLPSDEPKNAWNQQEPDVVPPPGARRESNTRKSVELFEVSPAPPNSDDAAALAEWPPAIQISLSTSQEVVASGSRREHFVTHRN